MWLHPVAMKAARKCSVSGKGMRACLGEAFLFVCVCVWFEEGAGRRKRKLSMCVYVRDISRVGKAGIALFNLLCGSPTIQL